uniref:Uncharacterized protein n=1 Tax=viral metagenome TaxID=1070528 RepID=A0A6M3K0B7_9ZZZZ
MNTIVKDKKTDREIPLLPKKDCKYCYGRGWLAYIHPSATQMRVVKPCHCVGYLVSAQELEGKWGSDATQKTVI